MSVEIKYTGKTALQLEAIREGDSRRLVHGEQLKNGQSITLDLADPHTKYFIRELPHDGGPTPASVGWFGRVFARLSGKPIWRPYG